ncbi:hypothetical protein COOONC_16445 [Cooperia oncophora]
MMEHFSLFDMLIDEWTVNWPFIKHRSERLMEPQYTIADFIRGQIEQRKLEIANGTHVLQGEGDDFVDAFLIPDCKKRGADTPALSYGARDNGFQEIHRCAQLVTMNLWRSTSEDTTVGSYVIPQGTTITAQVSVIMSDEKYFKDHCEFNPDRYSNGDKLEQKVVAFGLGKRSCLGESLAQAELYLIIANILLRYNINADPAHPPRMKAMHDFTTVRKPYPYHIQFERR